MYGSEDRGFDGNKKVKGRKRHICVDILGNLLFVKVHAANIHDTSCGDFVAKETKAIYEGITSFCADAGYRGTTKNYIKNVLGLDCEISPKIKDLAQISKRRWVVERTIAWLNNSRRLAKDFEISCKTAECFIYIAMMLILLRRLF